MEINDEEKKVVHEALSVSTSTLLDGAENSSTNQGIDLDNSSI